MKNGVSVRELLSLMQYEERVNVISICKYWSSRMEGLNFAGEVLDMKDPDHLLDRPIISVYRSIHDRIVIEIE